MVDVFEEEGGEEVVAVVVVLSEMGTFALPPSEDSPSPLWSASSASSPFCLARIVVVENVF